MSFGAKASLAATSLAPMFLVYAFVSWSDGNKGLATALALAALVLFGACRWILGRAQQKVQEQTIRIKSVKIADQHLMAFVVSYLFPLVFSAFRGPESVRVGVLAIVFVMLLVAVYRSNAYSFNPVMGLIFGYHFYEVVTERDFTYLVVSQREIVNTRKSIKGFQLSPYMVLEAEG